jgi:hypothetical protein
MRDTLIEFLEHLRDYIAESGNNLAHDERESSEFVDIFLKDKLKELSIGNDLVEVKPNQNDVLLSARDYIIETNPEIAKSLAKNEPVIISKNDLFFAMEQYNYYRLQSTHLATKGCSIEIKNICSIYAHVSDNFIRINKVIDTHGFMIPLFETEINLTK